jgi:hypothetical protein
MRRISNWSAAKRKACVSAFRRMVGGHRKAQIENAIEAGRSLARLMANHRVILTGIDCVQMERYRRRYAVPVNLKGVMYSVATGKLLDGMLEERLNRKFESYVLPSIDPKVNGHRLRLVDRCPLCAKRTCRCVVVGSSGQQPTPRKPHKPSSHPLIGKVISVRGLDPRRAK